MQSDRLLPAIVLGMGIAGVVGCASPGAPRPPSLRLPAPPRDLVAIRRGELVHVSFSLPTKTTDGLLLPGSGLHGELCLIPAVSRSCTKVQLGVAQRDLPTRAQEHGRATSVVWAIPLPDALRTGSIRAAAIEVRLLNASSKGAVWSTPAWFAAGSAPPPVADLQAGGTRQGVLLRWRPVHDGGEVLLERTQAGLPRGDGAAMRPDVKMTLQADPGNSSASEVLDDSIQPNAPVHYAAYRRVATVLEGHRLVMESAISAPIPFTWTDMYPPPAPTGLEAVGFNEAGDGKANSAHIAVDLVWEPVDDKRVTGYMVTRSREDARGGDIDTVRLTGAAVPAPAFHDSTAAAGVTYRYTVIAVDAAGNRSPAVSTIFAGQ